MCKKKEKSSKKNLSRSEKKVLKSEHDTQCSNLEAQQKKETNEGYAAQVQKNVKIQQKVIEGAVKKQKATIASLDNLYDQHKKILNARADGSLQNNQHEFKNVMLGRVQALKDSVTYQKTTQKNFQMKDQTRGFIQAQGLNQHLFEQVGGLPIQHQITNELLDVLDSVADYALHHAHQTLQQHLISYCANLSSLTQQANHSNDLSVAMQGTNCCHGLYHYMNSLAGDVAHQYQHMVMALQYFNPVLEYGTAIAQGLIKGAAISCGIGAATAVGMAVAPVATPIVLTSVVVATALLIGSQASTHLATLGSHYIHSEWDQIDAYLNKSYEYVTSLQGVEKGAELVGGFATACYGGAMTQELQSLTSIRPVIATVHQSSGLVTESIGLMTTQALEEEMILSAKLLELPEFANFSMHYENIFGCKFFSILPESHPSLASAFEVAGMQGLLSSGEQTALSNFLMAQESSGVGSVAKSLIASKASSAASDATQVVTTSIESNIQEVGTLTESLIVQNVAKETDFVQAAEKIRSAAQMTECGYTTNLGEALQKEMVQALEISSPELFVDLMAPINNDRAVELSQLSLSVRQLKDLSRLTQSFTNLDNLIPEDI